MLVIAVSSCTQYKIIPLPPFIEDEKPPVGAGPTGIFAEGYGTEEAPYQISSAADLKALAENLGNGTLDKPYHYKLSDNITIDDSNWTPIGNGTRVSGSLSEDSVPFIGIFDGNGKTISGLNITAEDNSGIGFFSAISGEDTVVQNLTVTGKITAEDSTAAGLIAGIVTNGASIINCQAGSIETESSITAQYGGGLVGYMMGAGSIENSKNYATISNPDGSGTNLGGIVGTINYAADPNNPLSVSGCYNYGNINGNGYAGGVAGFVSDAVISDCHNESGAVISSARQSIGGIAGYVSKNTTISGCENEGTIKVKEGYSDGKTNSAIGGIVGFADIKGDSAENSITIENCTNNGHFEFNTETSNKTYNAIGGIAGVLFDGTILSSSNESDIKAPEGVTLNSVGGIVGSLGEGSRLSSEDSGTRSSNNGNISGNNNVGGIAGSVTGNSTIEHADNKGAVSGATEVGGIAGKVSSSKLSDTNNEAPISGTGDKIGGIAGYLNTDSNSEIASEIEKSSNTRSVTGENSFHVGGIVGHSSGTANTTFSIKDSDNSGEIKGLTAVGGIAGRISYTNISECDNLQAAAVTGTYTGSETNKGDNYGTGGIIGMGNASSLTGCDNSGTIKAAIQLGGIIGNIHGSGNTLTSSNSKGNLIIIAESTAAVASRRHFGGAVGYCKDLTANGVDVSGDITLEGSSRNTKYIGGFVGCISSTSSFTNCDATGITNSTGLDAKGFAGYGSEKGTYTNCFPNDANSGINS